jgi:hypothetical protein
MPKNKRPPPRKPRLTEDEEDALLAQALADLALDIAEQEDTDAAEQAVRLDALNKQVRNALRKKNDELLYGAIERALYADIGAYQLLRSTVEEAAATATVRRDGAPTMEIDAFLLPLFVHSSGGLQAAETFQDDAAFAELTASLARDGLESPQAKVVLISHAYDLDEIDSISYSHLNEMAREAAATMGEKKLVATPALERSIIGWAESGFGQDQAAVELRFLLGFSFKRADDPFYAAPAEEADADAWFAARLERFRTWTEKADPLVRRCLAADPARLELNFLYQDLFFGAKERAMAEGAMLAMMADINQTLSTHALAPDAVRAIVGAADVHDELVLRVNLYGPADTPGGADAGADAGADSFSEVPLITSDKPFDPSADLEVEVDDICDALATIGITHVAVARRFDRNGKPQEVQPVQPVQPVQQGEAGLGRAVSETRHARETATPPK